MQAQRFELKYVIPDSITPAISDFLSSYLELDPFAASSENSSYTNHSIYYDSDNLHTYHSVLKGEVNRYKLRVRYYDENPDSPVFMEIKRRQKDIILKKRCAVPRHAFLDALAGDTRFVDPKELDGHTMFCHTLHQINATPRSHVAYDREAWTCRDGNSVRVTIDRNVRAVPRFDYVMTTTMENPVYVFGQKDVLELKFTNRPPDWIRDLVRAFKLVQTGGAKYAGGIRLYGEQHFAGRHHSYLSHASKANPCGDS